MEFAHPLRMLFLDLNSYFASVEQQERPELRGRPVAVVPLEAETTCCLAASYEAKAYGVRTGTSVADARAKCPDLRVVVARPAKYTYYHERIREAVETVLPVDKVCSVDEMQFRLIGREREPAEAERLARRLKSAIRRSVGSYLRCSIGIAPNAFLAKVGTEMQKPDGLVTLTADVLLERLARLRLTDFPGINRRMAARLQAHGILTTAQMLSATPHALRVAFGSIVGERWYHLLRGVEFDPPEEARKSLSHSHVLPPEMRTEEGTRQVLLRLTTKAAARLRGDGLCARRIGVAVKGLRRSWKAQVRIPGVNDTRSLTEAVANLWPKRGFDAPLTAYVTLFDLVEASDVTPSLFADDRDDARMSGALDAINQRFGKHKVHLASMAKARDTADEKIAFGKATLFVEGLGDHAYSPGA